MPDREKVIRIIDELIFEAQKEPTWKAESALKCLKKELLKEQAIVRCRDCKHFAPDGVYTMCYLHNGLSQGEDWYCADGERRKEQ